MEVTLDTNAVIALANDEPDSKYLKPIRDLYHRQELVTLSVGRITFLEAMPKEAIELPHDIAENDIAEKRIAAAGLNIDRVHLYRSRQPIAYYCLECHAITFGHEYDIAYAQRIHNILTGDKKIDSRYYKYRQRRINDPENVVKKAWHNHFNDVWGLVEHVSWGGDIFVTRDDDFLKKRDKLAIVVPGKILSPKETLEELSKMSLTLPKTPEWQPRLVIPQCAHCNFKQRLAS